MSLVLAEWFASIGSAATRRAYQSALPDFMAFVGIYQAGDFRAVTRAHVIAWRDDLKRRELARKLLGALGADTVQAKRDQAILVTPPYHALRRDELCKLTVKDARHERRGVAHLKIVGKSGKTRYVPLHPAA